VREYALRRGSGGQGELAGGDGLVRELEALTDMDYSLLTERRRHPPPGAAGGGPGARGRNLLMASEAAARGAPAADAPWQELPSKAQGHLRPGDRLRIETPGGGGYGEATGEAAGEAAG
jgi:N-methylhydantoinase B